MTHSNGRNSQYPVDRQFLDRWSPRAFTGESIPDEQLFSLFEAARWAPSASNRQPWRFVYGRRGTQPFSRILDTLDEGNQRWARNASVLVVIISKTHNRSAATGELRPAYTHAFDTGAAWCSLALQATLSGLHAHAMAGIDREKAMRDLAVPNGFRVEAGLAIGKLALAESLPDDLREREKPSQRNPIETFAFEGSFTGNSE
ncbi:nitroreductase family protein [Sinorhizobium sp. BG8]|uniref:nitroreductase family protein n=1 Tax=Sinorhizobium sp. BG8 TaxID=2613773 RepID=UPI00193E53F7|nr:nitroreductase family protein [Sinorhizobium sp. BG8]QRM53649.1 nitroreductase family protein [Sinorhizobium sp. BG8]